MATLADEMQMSASLKQNLAAISNASAPPGMSLTCTRKSLVLPGEEAASDDCIVASFTASTSRPQCASSGVCTNTTRAQLRKNSKQQRSDMLEAIFFCYGKCTADQEKLYRSKTTAAHLKGLEFQIILLESNNNMARW
jgi:hypothetical protein